MKPDEIVGIVLAGGRSSRIGGDDKCLQPLGGKPMLAYVLARLRLQVSDIVISPNSDRLAGFGAPVIVDNVSGFQGPLAGVEAPLTWIAANRSWCFFGRHSSRRHAVHPVNLVCRLAVPPGTMAVARSETGLHPVVALWPVTMAADLKEALAGDLHKVSWWAEMLGAADVFFPPSEIGGQQADPFFNINRKEDLVTAEGLLKREPEPS